MIFSSKRFLVGLIIVFLDIFIYIVLGVMMMAYDDNYNESKGEYGSWTSMTTFDKTISCLVLFWNVVNIFTAIFILHTFIKQIRNKYIDKN